LRRLETRLEGPILIELDAFRDERGFFCETYRHEVFSELGVAEEMVQDNHSRSRRGVVRGLHFQIGAGTSKLIRCANGAIFDVVVDLRRGSPTFGQWEGFELSADNMLIAYCPIGFAHGFCTLSEQADVLYKQSNYYSGEVERGIKFDDPDIGIEWPTGLELVVSARDCTAPPLRDVVDELPFVYQS
jgi:dTDP-4-dehydrorhamnose 3,5-epimerase